MRLFASFLAFLAFAGAAFAEPVTLRPQIVAQGPALTWNDVFEGAGEAGAQAFRLSPPPGEGQAISAQWLAARAGEAGLEWVPPAGLTQVFVSRAEIAARASAGSALRPPLRAQDAAVRRGDMIQLVYSAPGVELSMRARALENGAVGDTIRILNIQSEREIDAVVTSDGRARAR